jgi:hypothetical protein
VLAEFDLAGRLAVGGADRRPSRGGYRSGLAAEPVGPDLRERLTGIRIHDTWLNLQLAIALPPG